MNEWTPERRAGGYVSAALDKNIEKFAYVLRFGDARPSVHPFTGEKCRTTVPNSWIAFARQIAKHGLNDDSDFMLAAISAIAENGLSPLVEILEDLEHYQEHGDGNCELQWSAIDGSSLDAKELRSHIHYKFIDELRIRMSIDWPRNAEHYGACPCCGFHTLVDPPASGQDCRVCYWSDSCDLADPWNMTKWGYMPGEREYWKRVSPETFRPWPDISKARESFERCGAEEEKYAIHARKPLKQELPRYDWATDPRPYRSGELT